ncbi:hypothetical protein BsWGS_14970 [Bradybaena similaris]
MEAKLSAFSRPSSSTQEDDLLYDVSEFNCLARTTGGLSSLYDGIRFGNTHASCAFNSYTNSDGHFVSSKDTILISRYHNLSRIGINGQSAVLLEAKDSFRNMMPVVIKVMHTAYFAVGLKEVETLRKMNAADPRSSSCTIRLLNSFRFESHVCLVFPRLSSLPLTAAIARKCLSKDEMLSAVRKISLHILSALAFLRSQNIIHADIKPENILMHKDGDVEKGVTLIDFGNAIHHIHQEVSLYYSDFQLQTLPYRAPEVHLGNPFGVEVDMWSFGCVLLELLTGQLIFAGTDRADSLQKMMAVLGPLPTDMCKRGKYYSELAPVISAVSSSQKLESGALRLMSASPCIRNYDFASFLSGLLTYHPDKRLTPWEALQHPFMAPVICIPYFLSDVTKDTGVIKKSDYSFKQNISSNMHRLYPSTFDLLRAGTSDRPLMEHTNVALVEPFDLTSRPGKDLISQPKCENRSHNMQDKDALCILPSEMTRASRIDKYASSDLDTQDAVRFIKCELPCHRNIITQEMNKPCVSGHATSLRIDRVQKHHMNGTFSMHNKKSQYETSLLIAGVQKDHTNSTFSMHNKKSQLNVLETLQSQQINFSFNSTPKFKTGIQSSSLGGKSHNEKLTNLASDNYIADESILVHTVSSFKANAQNCQFQGPQFSKTENFCGRSQSATTNANVKSEGAESATGNASVKSESATGNASVKSQGAESATGNASVKSQGAESATGNARVKSESATGNASVKSEGAESATGNASLMSEGAQSATRNVHVKSESATGNASVQSEGAESATRNACVKSEGAESATRNARVKSEGAESATRNARVKSEGAESATRNVRVKSGGAICAIISTCLNSDRTEKMDSTNWRNNILRTDHMNSSNKHGSAVRPCNNIDQVNSATELNSAVRFCKNTDQVNLATEHNSAVRPCNNTNHVNSITERSSAVKLCNNTIHLDSSPLGQDMSDISTAVKKHFTMQSSCWQKPKQGFKASNSQTPVYKKVCGENVVDCNTGNQLTNCFQTGKKGGEINPQNYLHHQNSSKIRLNSPGRARDMKHWQPQLEMATVVKLEEKEVAESDSRCKNKCGVDDQVATSLDWEKDIHTYQCHSEREQRKVISGSKKARKKGRSLLNITFELPQKECWQPQLGTETIIKPNVTPLMAESDSYCKLKCEVDDQVATCLGKENKVDACRHRSEGDQRKFTSSSKNERQKGCSLLNTTCGCHHIEEKQFNKSSVVSDSLNGLKHGFPSKKHNENGINDCSQGTYAQEQKHFNELIHDFKQTHNKTQTGKIVQNLAGEFSTSPIIDKASKRSLVYNVQSSSTCAVTDDQAERPVSEPGNDLKSSSTCAVTDDQAERPVSELGNCSEFAFVSRKTAENKDMTGRELLIQSRNVKKCILLPYSKEEDDQSKPQQQILPRKAKSDILYIKDVHHKINNPQSEVSIMKRQPQRTSLMQADSPKESTETSLIHKCPTQTRNSMSRTLEMASTQYTDISCRDPCPIVEPGSSFVILSSREAKTDKISKNSQAVSEVVDSKADSSFETASSQMKGSSSRTRKRRHMQETDYFHQADRNVQQKQSRRELTFLTASIKTKKNSKTSMQTTDAPIVQSNSQTVQGGLVHTQGQKNTEALQRDNTVNHNMKPAKCKAGMKNVISNNLNVSGISRSRTSKRGTTFHTKSRTAKRGTTFHTKSRTAKRGTTFHTKSRTAKRGTTFHTKSRTAKRGTTFQANINSALNRNTKSCLTNSLSCGIKNLEVAQERNIGEQPSDASRLFRAKAVKRALSFSTKSSPQITDHEKCATTSKKAPSRTLGLITPSLNSENSLSHCVKHNEYCEFLDLPSSGSNKNTNSKFMRISFPLSDLNSSDPYEFKVSPFKLQQKLNANNLKRTKTAHKKRSNRRSQTTKKRNNKLNTAAKFVVCSASSATIRDLVEEKSKYLFRHMNTVSPLTMVVHNMPQNSGDNNQKHLQSIEGQVHLRNQCQMTRKTELPGEDMLLSKNKHLKISPFHGHQPGQVFETLSISAMDESKLLSTLKAFPSKDDSKLLSTLKAFPSKDDSKLLSTLKAFPSKDDSKLPSTLKAFPSKDDSKLLSTLKAFPSKDDSKLLSTLKAFPSKDDSKLPSTLKAFPSKDDSKLLSTLKAFPSKDDSKLPSTLKASPSKDDSKLLSTLKASPSNGKLQVKVSVPKNKVMTVDKKCTQSAVSEETNTTLGHLCFEKESAENKEFSKNIETDSHLPVNSILFPHHTRVGDCKPAGHDCLTINFLQTSQLVPDICDEEEDSADEEVLLLD